MLLGTSFNLKALTLGLRARRSQEIFLHDVPTRAPAPVKLILEVHELRKNKVLVLNDRSKECEKSSLCGSLPTNFVIAGGIKTVNTCMHA